MKNVTELLVVEHKGYVIITEEGIQNGIFFRSPLQKVGFDVFTENPKFSAWTYIRSIKNPIKRLYEYLIGNGKIISNAEYLSKDDNWAGFNGNILCFPIYFRRTYRALTALSCKDNNIKKITSYGYSSEFNTCAGDCVVEKTTIHTRAGKLKKKLNKTYHFTYSHIVKALIDR